MRSYNVAVIGATGNVGREILNILSRRNFPVGKIYALASSKSAGIELGFGSKQIKAQALGDFDFSLVDIVLSSAGAKVAREFAPKAVASGAVVIDNSSCFRMDKDVALVVPEVNAFALRDFGKRRIIANPNCSTIQMVLCLKPLYDLYGLRMVSVSTYQSVSGAGKAAMDELFEQTRSIFNNQSIDKKSFSKQIAFNVIPQIDKSLPSGDSKEEWKMVVETKKIMSDDGIEVIASCVRVPVFISHGLAIHCFFEAGAEVDLGLVANALSSAPGVKFVDDDYVTPLETAGCDEVYISRLRSVSGGVAMWSSTDNLLKGAALNAVQIAEILVKEYTLKEI